jgi:hypothetical protein
VEVGFEPTEGLPLHTLSRTVHARSRVTARGRGLRLHLPADASARARTGVNETETETAQAHTWLIDDEADRDDAGETQPLDFSHTVHRMTAGPWRTYNDLSKDVARLLAEADAALSSNRWAIRNTGAKHVFHRLYDAAALRHCCLLLKEIEQSVRAGQDMTVRLAGRALVEAWITAVYLHFGGYDALIKIVQDTLKTPFTARLAPDWPPSHTQNRANLRGHVMIKNQTGGHTKSAFSAALDPNRTTEMTITATDRRYRATNKYADAQRPLFGMSAYGHTR